MGKLAKAKDWLFRSAITGRFVKRIYALLHPDTTTKEKGK